MSIIDEIYQGKFNPAELTVPHSPQFEAAKQSCVVASELLDGQLTDAQKEYLEQYLGAQADFNNLLYLEFFRLGMRTGAQLYQELMSDDK